MKNNFTKLIYIDGCLLKFQKIDNSVTKVTNVSIVNLVIRKNKQRLEVIKPLELVSFRINLDSG